MQKKCNVQIQYSKVAWRCVTTQRSGIFKVLNQHGHRVFEDWLAGAIQAAVNF